LPSWGLPFRRRSVDTATSSFFLFFFLTAQKEKKKEAKKKRKRQGGVRAVQRQIRPFLSVFVRGLGFSAVRRVAPLALPWVRVQLASLHFRQFSPLLFVFFCITMYAV
jgi:hypothetical protein